MGSKLKTKSTLGSLGISIILASLAIPLAVSPASALEDLTDAATEQLQAIEEVTPDVLEDRFESLEVTDVEVQATTTEERWIEEAGETIPVNVENITTVPLDASSPINISTEGIESSASIGLPFAESTGLAEVLDDGTPVFDHENGSSSVPVIKDDGSVQITTIIESADAPTRYDYPTDVEGLASIEELEGGTLLFTDANGEFLAAIAPAWAKDAAGVDIPTRYEVDGTTVTQVVDHDTAVNVQYPVVADPWWGKNLFSYVTRDTFNGKMRINAQKSTWGQVIHTAGYANGQRVFLTSGLTEVASRQPQLLSMQSLVDQYVCHVIGGIGNIAGAWNFEKTHPNRTVHWSYGVARHRCNWNTPNGI